MAQYANLDVKFATKVGLAAVNAELEAELEAELTADLAARFATKSDMEAFVAQIELDMRVRCGKAETVMDVRNQEKREREMENQERDKGGQPQKLILGGGGILGVSLTA